MRTNYTYPKYETVGVIGAGSFGMTIAKLIAINVETVILFSRSEETVEQINATHRFKDIELEHNIIATSDLKEVTERCILIFPIVPSKAFRSLMQKMADYLKPYHLLIHGTKGLDSGYLYEKVNFMVE